MHETVAFMKNHSSIPSENEQLEEVIRRKRAETNLGKKMAREPVIQKFGTSKTAEFQLPLQQKSA